ncbi:MAG: hypothetical protein M3003_10600 [Candidatus Dormibacteraeota bacterium]|nr:hypothetical protein [Candidatus Dormibacteraeota bacterium]
MTMRHPYRYSRALVAVVLLVGGIAFAAPPAAASSANAPAAGAICGTKTITRTPAPGVGKSAKFTLPSAGSVTMLHQSTASLKVTSTTVTSGWKNTVITASGKTVHVGFQQVKLDNEQERFWARLNATATTITTIVQTCT